MIADSIGRDILSLAARLSGAESAEFVLLANPIQSVSIDLTASGATSARTAALSANFGSRRRADTFPEGVPGLKVDPTRPDAVVRSIALMPLTGPSAEPGWLAVTHQESNRFTLSTLADLERPVSILEQLLDRSTEHERIRELSEQLRRAQDQLAVSNQELEQFAYIAAHELVAPLRSVAVYAELLEGMGAPDNVALRSCISEIRQGVALMNQQVQSLLLLSRSEVEEATLDAVDLSEVVTITQDTLADILTEVNAHVSVGPLPWVSGRAVPLQSVFANLITNAVRYRDHTRRLEIAVTSQPVDGGVEISVTDNGSGVDSNDRQRIFKMFERGATSEPGTGIGLALSRRIMESCGGSMGVQPGDPHGASFWMFFPT